MKIGCDVAFGRLMYVVEKICPADSTDQGWRKDKTLGLAYALARYLVYI